MVDEGKMDRKFVYAILASFILHGLIIALWPRMRHPQVKEPEVIAGVALIEDLSSIDLNKKDVVKKGNSNPPENGKNFDEIQRPGRLITDRIIEELGPRSWEKMPRHDLHIPQILLPKQTIMPGYDEYAIIWPEEFAGPIQMDTKTYLPPQGEIGHKGISSVLSDADISDTLLFDEFPEEMPSQQIPDITWKGTPRTWITKPEQPPTYKGDEEGLVKVRFWVNENGEVVNAIPVQKLSVELEEKALAYIFSWRFEPSLSIPLQEGIIRINFRLDQNRR